MPAHTLLFVVDEFGSVEGIADIKVTSLGNHCR